MHYIFQLLLQYQLLLDNSIGHYLIYNLNLLLVHKMLYKIQLHYHKSYDIALDLHHSLLIHQHLLLKYCLEVHLHS